MQKTKLIWLVAFGVSVVAIALALILATTRQSEPELGTRSPDGTYLVEIRERGGWPTNVFVEDELRLSISKDGKSFVEDDPLFVADMFETPFRERFTKQGWLADDVVSFSSRAIDRARSPLPIHVRNATEQRLTYLCVRTTQFGVGPQADALYFLIDLEPGATREVPNSISASRIACWGLFEGGARLEWKQESFRESIEAGRFVVEVQPGGVTIGVEASGA